MKYLSGVELYYASPEMIKENKVRITGDDYKHIVKVMRHFEGDEIYITNGNGKIFLSIIGEINRDSLTSTIKKIYDYENKYSGIFFCIPKLRNNERLEFALEKCTELGITNFIIFDSERTIHKSYKKERLRRILLAAMKQSLRCYLPRINIMNSVHEILEFDGIKILFEQNSEKKIPELKINPGNKYYFIFGPEGGFTEEERNLFYEKYNLAENRLRTETAIIKCASFITL